MLAAFYRAVIQAVILFGSEMWVLYESTEKRIVGIHTRFLRKVTGKRTKR